MNDYPKITGDLSSEEQIDQVKKFNNPEFVPKMLENSATDMILGGEGEFGKSPNNPIPVNGTWGERIYLSFLRCEFCGKEVLFHRIGSLTKDINNKSFIVDNYEVCCYDGCTREHIYLAPYFPKRSTYLPKGYSNFNLNQNFATKLFIDFPTSLGSNWFIKDFPFGLEDFIKFYFTEVVGNPSMTRGRLEKYKEVIERLKDEKLILHRKEIYKTIKELSEKYDLTQQEYLDAMKMEDPFVCWEKNSNGEMPSKLEQWKIMSRIKASEYSKNKKLLDNKS